MQSKKNKAFTLIEIMIVISIIWIISVLVVVPYNLYSDISRVNLSKEIITQTISEARNSSAWLINTTGKNQNIAIFFTKWWNSIKLVWFPFDYSWSISEVSWDLIRELPLEKNINTNKFVDNNWNELNELIMYFKSPNWDSEIYKNATQIWTLKNIIIGLKESTNWILSKTIEIK